MPNKSKTSRSKENNSMNYNKIIISSVVGTVMFFALISIFALLALKSDAFSQSVFIPIGYISAAVSACSGGYISVRPVKKNGALLGALTGFVQALISSAVLFFINDKNTGSGIFIFMLLIIVFSTLGGISAVNLKVRKKYK